MQAANLVFKFRVGSHRVMFTVPPALPGHPIVAIADWMPRMPRSLSKDQADQYMRERDAVMRKVAQLINRPGAVPFEVLHQRA